MEPLARWALLYDLYGGLLTERQRQAFEYRYSEDLSYGEIAAALGVSRPAAADLVRRAQATLEGCEATVGALAQYLAEGERLRRIRSLLEEGATAEARRAILAWQEERGEADV